MLHTAHAATSISISISSKQLSTPLLIRTSSMMRTFKLRCRLQQLHRMHTPPRQHWNLRMFYIQKHTRFRRVMPLKATIMTCSRSTQELELQPAPAEQCYTESQHVHCRETAHSLLLEQHNEGIRCEICPPAFIMNP